MGRLRRGPPAPLPAGPGAGRLDLPERLRHGRRPAPFARSRLQPPFRQADRSRHAATVPGGRESTGHLNRTISTFGSTAATPEALASLSIPAPHLGRGWLTSGALLAPFLRMSEAQRILARPGGARTEPAPPRGSPG